MMTQMMDLTQRPVHVTFELRAVEDRENRIRSGRFVAKDVPYALVTPPGSGSFTLEAVAAEWIEKKEKERDPFARHYQELYQAWLNGIAPPEHGTPLRHWAGLSPAEMKNLQAANLRTVEDVAGATASELERIGMGGQALKNRAQKWLQSASDVGRAAEALELLTVELNSARAEIETLRAQLASMGDAEKSAEKPKRGRPKKVKIGGEIGE